MKKVFLIINILNFYTYQFVDKHKKILPTYPTDVTSEKILGFLLINLCLIIFLIIDKLYLSKLNTFLSLSFHSVCCIITH